MDENKQFGNSEQLDDTISRQAALDALEQLVIPEDMCVFEILSHIELVIGTLPSAQQWIPCSERLPEKDGEYLTTTEDGLCDVESYGDGEWFYDDVVAWAPLPEPWKGNADD